MAYRGKNASKANRGMPFEELLRFVHAQYQAHGTACVHKVPTEFIPLRDASGSLCGCKVEAKSCVDYLGRYKWIPVAVEAKHTEEARIQFSRVEPHQADYLDAWTHERNAVGIVLVSFGLRRFFVVPWAFWRTAREDWQTGKKKPQTVSANGWQWTTPGMASVSADQLHPAWEIKTGGITGLPYLDIIDRMEADRDG